MATIKAEYYRLNGNVWDLYYFRTTADMIIETENYKVLTGGERSKIESYLNTFNASDKLLKLNSNGKIDGGMIPSLPYLPLDGSAGMTGHLNMGDKTIQYVSLIKNYDSEIKLGGDHIEFSLEGSRLARFLEGELTLYDIPIKGVADPQSGKDAANKDYVDAFALTSTRPVEAAEVATTGNITLSGTPTLDGYKVSVGDRVLVWKQTNKSQNGIYEVKSGSWTKIEEDSNQGSYVFIEHGNNYNDWYFYCKDQDGTWIDTGRPDTIKPGNGLEKSGTTIGVENQGITSGMLAGNISWDKLAAQTSSDIGSGLMHPTDGGGIGTHLDNIYAMIRNLRGTPNASTAYTDTILSVKGIAESKNRVYSGNSVPSSGSGYNTGDVFLKTIVST